MKPSTSTAGDHERQVQFGHLLEREALEVAQPQNHPVVVGQRVVVPFLVWQLKFGRLRLRKRIIRPGSVRTFVFGHSLIYVERQL